MIRLVGILVVVLVALPSCGSESSTPPADAQSIDAPLDAEATADADLTAATVAALCTKLFACGLGNYTDEAQCRNEWIDNASVPASACSDSDSYIVCTAPCPEKSCGDFPLCDATCWDQHCL